MQLLHVRGVRVPSEDGQGGGGSEDPQGVKGKESKPAEVHCLLNSCSDGVEDVQLAALCPNHQAGDRIHLSQAPESALLIRNQKLALHVRGSHPSKPQPLGSEGQVVWGCRAHTSSWLLLILERSVTNVGDASGCPWCAATNAATPSSVCMDSPETHLSIAPGTGVTREETGPRWGLHGHAAA